MNIQLRGITNLRAGLKRIGQEGEVITKRELMRSGLNVQAGAKRRVPVDRGPLRNSIAIKAVRDGLEVQVGTNSKYAKPVEFGSRPHTPPIKEIQAWAKRKGLPPEAAGAIYWSITHHGTRAHPFLFPAFEEERPKFYTRLRRALLTEYSKQGPR